MNESWKSERQIFMTILASFNDDFSNYFQQPAFEIELFYRQFRGL